jgi:ATP-dependent RNA helicase SUPV3L1/SUV3
VQRAARSSARRFVRSAAPAAPTSASPFAKLGLLRGEQPGGELTEEQFVQRVVDATHEAFVVDMSGSISFEGQPLARLVRGNDRRSPQVALAEADVWTGGARRRLERRLLALSRDLVAEAMGGFPAEALTGEGHSGPMRGLAYRLAEGLGVMARGEGHEQWRLLDEDARERLQALGVQVGQRNIYVAGALTPPALERRCVLTALLDGRPPEGAPGAPVLDVAKLGGRDARRFGYEVVGPVALRVDVVERLAGALRAPGGAPQVNALAQELGLAGAVRAQVLRELGGPPTGVPSKRRRRRRQRREGTAQQAAAPPRAPARPPAPAGEPPVYVIIKRSPRPAPAPHSPGEGDP